MFIALIALNSTSRWLQGVQGLRAGNFVEQAMTATQPLSLERTAAALIE